MFYSQFILAKKGPLGTIWIAAHLERKLRKAQVHDTNIPLSVDSILFPEVPIALRLSGHLLLGVVRIYSRKVGYLYADCSDALLKIKQAFHSGTVDLPPEAVTAPFESITMPESFDFDALDFLPDFAPPHALRMSVDHNIATYDQITLQDSFRDDYFLESQVQPTEHLEVPEVAAAGSEKEASEMEQTIFGEGIQVWQRIENSSVLEVDMEEVRQAEEAINKELEAQGGTEQQISHDAMEVDNVGSTKITESRAVPHEEEIAQGESPEVERLRSEADISEHEMGRSVDLPVPSTLGETPKSTHLVHEEIEELTNLPGIQKGKEAPATFQTPASLDVLLGNTPASFGVMSSPQVAAVSPLGFPSSALKVGPAMKKRKPVLDGSTVLPSEFMRNQLNDTSDIRRVRNRKAQPSSFFKLSTEISWDQPILAELSSHIVSLHHKIASTSLASVAETELITPMSDLARLDVPTLGNNSSPFVDVASDKPLELVEEEANGRVASTVREAAAEVMEGDEVETAVESTRQVQGADEDIPRGTSVLVAENEEGKATPLTAIMQEEPEGNLLPSAAEYLPEVEEVELPLEIPVAIEAMEMEMDAEIASLERPTRKSISTVVEPLTFLGSSMDEATPSQANIWQDGHPKYVTREGTEGAEESRGWSQRTRGVGKYLQSAFNKLETEKSSDRKISLKNCIFGNTKKVAARMFFETLVLKTRDYIDVEQVEPYGDILLSAMPKLSKAQFQ